MGQDYLANRENVLTNRGFDDTIYVPKNNEHQGEDSLPVKGTKMGSKRYSNKGVNAARRAEEMAAAEKNTQKQTFIIFSVAIALVVVALVLEV